jgi:DNA-directed RNA polymerase specialized sigma54-like protein
VEFHRCDAACAPARDCGSLSPSPLSLSRRFGSSSSSSLEFEQEMREAMDTNPFLEEEEDAARADAGTAPDAPATEAPAPEPDVSPAPDRPDAPDERGGMDEMPCNSGSHDHDQTD